MQRKIKKPSPLVAIAPVLVTMVLLVWLVVIKGGAPHIAIILGIAVTAIGGTLSGHRWEEMLDGMIKAATAVLPVIGILMAIGMLVGAWILAGTVPMLMLYGFDFIHPAVFLPAVTCVCALISLATGTSWGTLGTIGIALMGVGEGLGIPMYLTAGAIVSGAFFGDKISPLSDTTNFCAGVTGVSLYRHVAQLLPSTIPAMVIALVIYYFLGNSFASAAFDGSKAIEVEKALDGSFVLSGFLLLPPIVVVIAALLRWPPIPSLVLGIFVGVVLAMAVQGAPLEAVLGTVMYGYRADTGVDYVDTLLSKGGLNSMMWIAGLMILTVAFGGLLERTRSIEVMVETLVTWVKGIASSVASSTVVMLTMTFTTDLYIAYTVTARVFCPVTRSWGYSTANVSRVIENSGTMMAPLVPWGAAGVFTAGNLGVPTIMYAPFAFACWIAPLFDILWGVTGRFLPKATESEISQWKKEDRKVANNGKLIPISQWLESESKNEQNIHN